YTLDMVELSAIEPRPAADHSGAPMTTALTYATRVRKRRIWQYVCPGTPLFFLMVLALAAGGTWGGWKWRLQQDQKAFEVCAGGWSRGQWCSFAYPPSRAALRHLARMQSIKAIDLDWRTVKGLSDCTAFHEVALTNVSYLRVGGDTNADALFK